MNPLAVQLYSVRDRMTSDRREVLRRLAEIGYGGVEPYDPLNDPAGFRDLLTEFGLTACSTHAAVHGDKREDILAAARTIGLDTVIVPAISPDEWADAAGVDRTAAVLNETATRAADLGIRIGYHNHWWELESRIDGRVGFEVLADALDPEVDLEVDTYWATAGGANAPELLKRLGARVKALHIKDGGLNTDASGQVPAGQGQVPVLDVLAAAPDALRVIEFDQYDGDIYAGIEASYAFVSGAAR